MDELSLRYGLNPHQVPARAFAADGRLPFRILGGRPGYVNLLDALNSWQLVRELGTLSGLPAAASFKHVSPAGAALGLPLSDELARSCAVKTDGLSPLACAYARARGADRMSSFGDWAAFSEPVDEPTARLLRREVSDGCIAPGYEPAALALLREKKGGGYPVLEMDRDWTPPELERREVFGVTLEQRRNDAAIGPALLDRVVTRNRELPEAARRDMLVAAVVLKYVQSNSVCVVREGQVIGVGAGQQSRIHCTRLACAKADKWLLRLHPQVLGLRFRKGVSRADRATAVDLYLEEDATAPELDAARGLYEQEPAPLERAARQEWLARFPGAVLGSDAFIPFRDNIDRAARSGVGFVVQAGGSTRDDDVIAAADEYGMAMVFTGLRLFHH
ncbi:MAG TPA: phosphoribosylaminoimidazolecarboxamide formyltransferase [candidate division WOR-3 bacterium]|uniref:Phosphoribosylaminoimidazolecarboxamide formyltransferase n=1 Tax=candidate division WOR-3 bacterium TaxID=2052148 RepID=A0A7V0T5M2_UNCW3|nr:phosphoribosylaminoimidazolecarboxamide formyltransferase [candidate division WOR-3 bacterium]